jgi:hypothetical protein
MNQAIGDGLKRSALTIQISIALIIFLGSSLADRAASEGFDEDPTFRSDKQFFFDAAIADGLWFESRYEFTHDKFDFDVDFEFSTEEVTLETDTMVFTQRIAFGIAPFEVGLSIPIIDVDADLRLPAGISTQGLDSPTGVGDLEIVLKSVFETAITNRYWLLS